MKTKINLFPAVISKEIINAVPRGLPESYVPLKTPKFSNSPSTILVAAVEDIGASIRDVKKALWKVKHGYWYVPKIPTKYAKKRIYDGCGNCHYEKVPVRWRKGKKKFNPPMNPNMIVTSELTFKKLKGD